MIISFEPQDWEGRDAWDAWDWSPFAAASTGAGGIAVGGKKKHLPAWYVEWMRKQQSEQNRQEMLRSILDKYKAANHQAYLRAMRELQEEMRRQNAMFSVLLSEL